MGDQPPNVGTVDARLGAFVPVEELDATGTSFRSLLVSLELWLPLGVLGIIALACFIWPQIHSIPNPFLGNPSNANILPFSAHHILGTDPLGNDEMSEILYGGRISLEVGVGSVLVGLVVGGMLGVIAGYRGGMIETVVMRILDMFLAFPSLVLAIVIATYLGPSELHVIWAISFFSVPAFARLARANTLSLRERNFIVASKLCGTSDLRIIVRHVAPNILPQVLTFSVLGVAVSIIIQAALSFLGLGIPPPQPSWGEMISNAEVYINTQSYLLLIPSTFLFVTVICLNLSADALRARWRV